MAYSRHHCFFYTGGFGEFGEYSVMCITRRNVSELCAFFMVTETSCVTSFMNSYSKPTLRKLMN